MSQGSSATIFLESPREFFVGQIDKACETLKFQPLPLARNYLIDLLQHYMISTNLFPLDEETGKLKRETLAEIYLKAQNSPAPARMDLMKKLGDSSLYISGFFGDSLNRRLVDIDYYVDMGGVAYGSLSSSSTDESTSKMYGEFAHNFTAFVDVLTYISQESLIQTNGDLLKLYNRYLATGSRLAEDQLMKKGLINAELPKVKSNKM